MPTKQIRTDPYKDYKLSKSVAKMFYSINVNTLFEDFNPFTLLSGLGKFTPDYHAGADETVWIHAFYPSFARLARKPGNEASCTYAPMGKSAGVAVRPRKCRRSSAPIIRFPTARDLNFFQRRN
jgi:hypothetical protein